MVQSFNEPLDCSMTSSNELAEMFNHETTYIDERPGEARETLCDLTITQERIKYDPKGNLEKYVKGEISE